MIISIRHIGRTFTFKNKPILLITLLAKKYNKNFLIKREYKKRSIKRKEKIKIICIIA